jgi:hypothetical protein
MELTVSVLPAESAECEAADGPPFAEAEAVFNHLEPASAQSATRNPAAVDAAILFRIVLLRIVQTRVAQFEF